ncbi:MAG: hypothetical protein ACE5F1_10620 [Planctomycetota bacterium]
MKLGPVEFLALILLPLVLGVAVLRALGIRHRTDPLAFLGWAWVAGGLGTGLILYVWLWTGPDLGSGLVPSLALLASSGVLFFLGRRTETVPGEHPLRAAEPAWEQVFCRMAIAFVIFLTVERIMTGTLIPMIAGDGAGIWGLKSKAIYASSGFTPKLAERMSQRIFVQKDYPLLNPLLQLWTFVNAGEITHVANRLPIQLFTLAQPLIVVSALLRVVRPGIAGLLALALVAPSNSFFQTRLAASDAMVGLGAVMAFDAWIRWRRGGRPAWIGLGALALAFMLWSKNEGMLYLASMIAAPALLLAVQPRRWSFRFRPRGRHAWMLLPLLVLCLHWSFNRSLGFSSTISKAPEGNLLHLFWSQLGSYSPEVLGYFAAEIALNPSHSNLFVPCLVVLVLAFPRAIWRTELRPPTLALCFAYLGLLAAFIATPARNVAWQLDTAAHRVFFQLYPVTVLWLGYTAGSLFSRLATGREGELAAVSPT